MSEEAMKDEFVMKYLGHVNGELTQKVLEVCNYKAQLSVANDRIAALQKLLKERDEDIERLTSEKEE